MYLSTTWINSNKFSVFLSTEFGIQSPIWPYSDLYFKRKQRAFIVVFAPDEFPKSASCSGGYDYCAVSLTLGIPGGTEMLQASSKANQLLKLNPS